MYGARTGEARVVPVYATRDGSVGGCGNLVWSEGGVLGERWFDLRLRWSVRHLTGGKYTSGIGAGISRLGVRAGHSRGDGKSGHRDARPTEPPSNPLRNRPGRWSDRSVGARGRQVRAAPAADRETQLPPVGLGERDGNVCVAAGDQKLQQLSGADAARDGTQVQAYLRRLIRKHGERVTRKRCMRDYSMGLESMRCRVG